jgi:hypothetical protein
MLRAPDARAPTLQTRSLLQAQHGCGTRQDSETILRAPTRQVDVGLIRACEVERHPEPVGEGAAYRGRFERFGLWRDFAIKNSHVGTVADKG